ncbi:Asp23/Gls24 family envelope stress response protein [Nitrospira sp. M1]
MTDVTKDHTQETSPLASSQGKTTIADDVVAKMVTLAAKEIDGIYDIGSQKLGDQLTGLTQRLSGHGSSEQGVQVEVGEREVAIDLSVIAQYGVRIPDLTAAVRRNVIDRVERLLGLVVKEMNIKVSGLHLPEQEKAAPPPKRVE